MSDAVATRLDRPYGQTPEAQAAAVRRINREPDPEPLLAALGLATDPVVPQRWVVRNGQSYCPTCEKRVGAGGYCFTCNPKKRGEDE